MPAWTLKNNVLSPHSIFMYFLEDSHNTKRLLHWTARQFGLEDTQCFLCENYYYYYYYYFMQGIYNYIRETNHVSRIYNVATVLYLQVVLQVMLFSPWNVFCLLLLLLLLPRLINMNYNQNSETKVMDFLFNLLRINGLCMFLTLLAHSQQVLHKRHLVYWMRVMSVEL
jgi:hypothetical protein